ncbi:hypothetical protein IGJ16_001630 [Enterococcus pernyi]|uniref:hypothetical protein n=1 Tax=Enterococcus sp. DIV2389 TaxID=2774705 RepID=UPI003E1414EC
MQLIYIYINQPNKEAISLNLYSDYFYRIENNELKREKNQQFSSFIFQNNIKSISAFIGENGTGKSILLENIISTLLNKGDNGYFLLYKEDDNLYYTSNNLKNPILTNLKLTKISNKIKIFLSSNIIDSSKRYSEISGDSNLTLKYKMDTYKENYKKEEFKAQLKFVLKYKTEVERIINIPSELQVQVNSEIQNLLYSQYLKTLDEKISKFEKLYTNINSIEITLQKSSFFELDSSSIISLIGLKDSQTSFPDEKKQFNQFFTELIQNKKQEIIGNLSKLKKQSRIIGDIVKTIEKISRESSNNNQVKEGSYFYIYNYLVVQIISFFDFLYDESILNFTESSNSKNYIIEWAEDCLRGLTGNDYFIKIFSYEKFLKRLHSILEDCYRTMVENKENLILCVNIENKKSLIYQVSVIFYTVLQLFEDSPFYDKRQSLRYLGFNIFSECLAGLLNNTERMISMIDDICKNEPNDSIVSMELSEENIENYFWEMQNIKYVCNPLSFSWRDMSSGEYAMLNLFSFFPEEHEIEEEILLIIFDEGELHFHQSLQIKFINILKQFFKRMFPNKIIQILLASHSPFIITDIPNCDVYLLNSDSNDVLSRLTQKTFGANIQDILYNPFQLKRGMVGEYAKSKINLLHEEINKKQSEYPHEDIYGAINIIGEPLIRNRLLKEMYDKRKENYFDTNKEIEYLKQRIKELEGNSDANNN